MRLKPLTPTTEAEIVLRKVEGAEFLVRAGTHDDMILQEIWRRRGYSKHLRIMDTDNVLDVGAHIGLFSIWALLQAKSVRVCAYEPDPWNWEMAWRNVRLNGWEHRVTMSPTALTTFFGGDTDLYVSLAGRTSSSSHFVSRGRHKISVQTTNITDVIARFRPNVIKMDCEGAEAKLIPAIQDWSSVREIALEYHVSMLRDKDLSTYHSLLAILDREFDEVIAPRHHSGAWTRNIYARRAA